VRKGCIPGFWDPAPAREKLLLVRYSWKGKEAVVAVKGEEELVLPPKR
jgi:DnaJ family protein C protein 11